VPRQGGLPPLPTCSGPGGQNEQMRQATPASSIPADRLLWRPSLCGAAMQAAEKHTEVDLKVGQPTTSQGPLPCLLMLARVMTNAR
jgi:hypothetical protein